MPSGTAVANFNVATTDTWRDKQSGEQREHTEWHRIVLKGRLAEVAGEYLKKGSQVYLEGSNRTRKWTDSQQIERYTTEVHCVEMQMLGGRGNAPQDNSQRAAPQKGQRTGAGTQSAPVQQSGHCCKVSDEAAFCLIQRPYFKNSAYQAHFAQGITIIKC